MIPAPPRAGSFLSLSKGGFHRVAYTDWGPVGGRHAIVCAHGLTRNARDFDVLAAALATETRVVSVDAPGRGGSDWLANPAEYAYPTYVADMAALMAHIGAERVDWIGTSMGGLIGMMLAAQPGTPIRRLVVNDIGPFIPKAALERIASYVGAAPVFGSVKDLEVYLRHVHAQFGPLDDVQWAHLAAHGAVKTGDGRVSLHYDPAIADSFHAGPLADVDLWPVWDRIQCPVLVLRGRQSDLLLSETAAEMRRRGPKADLVEFDGIGHAPALMAADQINVVRNFLEKPLR